MSTKFAPLAVTVSYAVITPESAEHGEYAETGYMFGHGPLSFTFRMPIAEHDGVIDVTADMAAHDTLRLIRGKHCCYSARLVYRKDGRCEASFYTSEPQTESLRTGEVHEETVHVVGPARLVRALVKAAKPMHVHV